MTRVRIDIRPWHVAIATLVTSIVGGAVVTASSLRACDQRGASRTVLAGGLLFGVITMGVVPTLALPWPVVAGTLLAVNAAGAVVFASVLRRARAAVPAAVRLDGRPVGSRAGTFWIVAAGALIGAHAGIGVGALYLLGLDAWISTLFPTMPSRELVVSALVSFGFDLALVGAYIGRRFGTPRHCDDGVPLAWMIAGSLFGLVVWRTLTTLVIGMPAFQAQTLRSDEASVLAMFAESVTLGTTLRLLWYVGAIASGLLLLERRSDSAAAHARYVAGVVVVALAGTVTIAVYAGRVGYDLLVVGGLLERRDHPALARVLYERGLVQRPDGAASAHLQYRLALLQHRLGDREAAHAGFAKIVTSYSERPDLVRRSQRFLTALDTAARGAPRRIVPGIATRTEFKSAYCMPNSLALILQYWNVPLSAHRIGADLTPIDVGTTVSDASWYVHAHGLEQWLMPLADVDRLRWFIDRDVPLLVYIPQHVLAVIGYDDGLRSLVTYDVAQPDIWLDQPLADFLPEWRRELAVVGIVLPPERFNALPATIRQDLTRWTRALLHHDLHEPYHHSHDAADKERAFAHLRSSVGVAPELFFDIAHLLVRPYWRAETEALVDSQTLAEAARTGLTFARYDFADDQHLRELALLNLEIRNDDELARFLEARATDGSLEDHSDLMSLLGLLAYRAGDYERAVAYLSALDDDERFPLVLGDALERTRTVEGAIAEYRRVLDRTILAKDDARDAIVESMLLFSDRSDEPMLAARTHAIRRIAAIRDAEGRPEQILEPARVHLDSFPWDESMQRRFAASVATKLERETELPVSERDELTWRRERALELAAVLADPPSSRRAPDREARHRP